MGRGREAGKGKGKGKEVGEGWGRREGCSLHNYMFAAVRNSQWLHFFGVILCPKPL